MRCIMLRCPILHQVPSGICRFPSMAWPMGLLATVIGWEISRSQFGQRSRFAQIGERGHTHNLPIALLTVMAPRQGL